MQQPVDVVHHLHQKNLKSKNKLNIICFLNINMKLPIIFFIFNRFSFIFYKSIESYKNRCLRFNLKKSNYYEKYDKVLKTPFEDPRRFNITKMKNK